MHYNLVGVSTGYKRTRGKLTEIPLSYYMFVRRAFCAVDVTFPDKIRGYPVDAGEACFATSYLSAVVLKTDRHPLIRLPLILIMKAHSSLGDELIILAGASDKRVAEKAQSTKKLLKHKFAEAQEEQGQIPPHNNNNYKEIFIGYMKSPLIQEIDKKRQKCYPTVWS
ncbi:hypothetical protein C1646_742515 [Rhizophagus diaphanus]|nr:hypothetical protein C1646_742515 [Rhizophagus diaphanus] [Rhizophagus sp. MUCL 43196]